MKTEIRAVNSKSELEEQMQNAVTMGMEIKNKTDKQVILEKKEFGNIVLHIIIFILLGWWTLLIANVIYLAYNYVNNSKQLIITVKTKKGE